MPYQEISDSKKTRLFVSGLLVLLTIASSLAGLVYFNSEADAIGNVSNPVQAVSTTHESEEWVPELPVRLVIPAIDVDAFIQYVGLDPAGTGDMAVPSNFTDVGWYEPGVQPGMRGSAVIAGHYNGKDIPEAVFFDLHRLEAGDEIVVESAERIEDIFRVVRVETYTYTDPPDDIFVSTDGKKRLNLITCGGTWLPEADQYDQRTVVFTELLTDVE